MSNGAPHADDVKMAKKAASRIVKHNNLQFHPIERNLFDVFSGEGFETHSRYRFYKDRWFLMSGVRLDPSQFPNVRNSGK